MTRLPLINRIVRGALVGAAAGIALGLALLAMEPSVASAQAAPCHARADLARLLLDRFAERPAAVGLAASGRLIELYASDDSTTWTLVTTNAAGESCVVAVGEHWFDLKPQVATGPDA